MSTEKMNEVYLRGRISHIYGNDSFGSLQVPYSIVITRPTRENGQPAKIQQVVETYFPEVIFNSNTKTKNIIQTFRKSDNVLIKGYIASYTAPTDKGYEERTALYIDEIEHDATKMEQLFGLSGIGSKYAVPMHEIRLEAKITGMTKLREHMYEFRLECEKNDRTYPVTGTYFRAPADLDTQFKLNDQVYVIGYMQTARKEFRGKAVFSQTFVIDDIVSKKDVVAKYNEMIKAQNAENDSLA